jgi:hypothetical protein
MLQNSSTEMPTRMASANAIFWCRDLPLLLFFIMKNNAVPKLPTMAKNAKRTKYFMVWIMS